MIKSEISIVIKPISSLYDLLPNDNSTKYLKDLKDEYGEFITNNSINWENDKPLKLKFDKLKFDNYIKDEGSSFNFIIMPYDKDILENAYPDIDKNKFIDYTYEKVNNSEYISDKIENNIRQIQSKHPDLQYIKIVYYIPLYDTTQLEFRFKIKDKKAKAIQYKDIFNKQKLDKIQKLPFVTNLEIKDKIDESIEDIFKFLKKSKTINRKLLFLETLYNYSRNKQLREDYLLKSKYHKVVILYSTDFMEKDITSLNKDYYYELPSIKIRDTYFSETEKRLDKFKDDYNQNTYKVTKDTKDTYKCIGKLTNISKNKYKFSVKLKRLIFEENTEDTLIFYLNIDQYLGFLNRYTIDTKNELLDITNKTGNISLFNESDIKLFKYNNIDKSLGDNYELFIPKTYYLDKASFADFLTKKVTPNDFLKYFKSPTELKKYEVFLEQNYTKLKYVRKLTDGMLDDIYYFKLWLTMLFEQNTPFHLKPRDTISSSDTQYRLKLDDSILVYETNGNNKYEPIMKELLSNKVIKKQYMSIIDSIKPNYIIYVNLLLKKKDFEKSLYDCNLIKYNLIKYANRLVRGGKTKRKKLKYNKRNNKACITKRCLQQRYSRRKA